VIGILPDADVSQAPRAGQTFLDRLGKPVGDHDVCRAGLRRVSQADVFEDEDTNSQHTTFRLVDPQRHCPGSAYRRYRSWQTGDVGAVGILAIGLVRLFMRLLDAIDRG
jgi:hypothetical protein